MSARDSKCRACGEKWVGHIGIADTCAALQRANDLAKRLEAQVARLRAALKTLGHHAAD